MRNKVISGCFSLLLLFSTMLSAATIAKPDGKVLLTILGAGLVVTNDGNELQLDIKQLRALPQKTIVTHTRWTKGKVSFTGPLLRDVIKLSGTKGKFISAIAANEYKIRIPFEDFMKYDVIVALRKNDKRLTTRTKGPLWIIYPWSDHQELEQGVYYSRSIWQLEKLKIYE